jgi:hypothetical protein
MDRARHRKPALRAGKSGSDAGSSQDCAEGRGYEGGLGGARADPPAQRHNKGGPGATYSAPGYPPGPEGRGGRLGYQPQQIGLQGSAP